MSGFVMSQAQRAEDADLEDAYQRLFGSPDGEKVLCDLERYCEWSGLLRGKTPADTYENLGKRAVYLRIMKKTGRI